MEKKDIISSTIILRNDIQKCLSDLIDARLNRDRIQEDGALFKMESLMVSSAQQLDCIIDYLKEEEVLWEKKESYQIHNYSSAKQRIWEQRGRNRRK